MSDVIDIQAQPDSPTRWRTALESAIASLKFGRHIVNGQDEYLCIEGEYWTISSNIEEAIYSEVIIPLPMLRPDVAWIYQAILHEDLITCPGIFQKCWSNAPAAQACADELRQQLEEHIACTRQIFAEMAVEARRTDKLIA